MGLRDKLQRRIDWHRAELTPDYVRRQSRRSEYDEKYGMCRHGTHSARTCDGSDTGEAEESEPRGQSRRVRLGRR